jgi:hypothetical protein
VQIFDQQIAAQRQIAQQRGDRVPRGYVNAPPPPLPASLASPCWRLLAVVHALASRFEVAMLTN